MDGGAQGRRTLIERDANGTRGGTTSVGVVGLGYWGPNLMRAACDVDEIEARWACDSNLDALDPIARRYPGVGTTGDVDDLLADPELDAIVLATPVATHFDLARRALSAGKHVLVEKPMAGSIEECRELMDLARARGRVLMPGHTFLYSPPVMKVKSLLESGQLGDLHFGTSSRVNLGIHQRDVSVIYDLAPHDFSILLYWLGRPASLRAIGRASVLPGVYDVAFVDVVYGSGCIVHVELSWLAPTKLRRTVLVGARKMVVYEDTSSEQVRIYDRRVEMLQPASFGEFQLAYRAGDILTPQLAPDEPLKLELRDFVRAIREDGEPRSNMDLGLDVLRMIEAAEQSMALRGALVPLADHVARPELRRFVRQAAVAPESPSSEPVSP